MANIEQVLQTQVAWMEKRLDEIEVKVDGVETKIGTVETKVDTVETKVDEMSNTMTKVYEKLIGNALSPEGLIQDLENVKKDVSILKEFKTRLMWTFSIILAIGGVCGYLLGLLFSYLSVKK